MKIKSVSAFVLSGILIFTMIFSACKKDNNNDDDSPKNLINYSGKTDWNKEVSFQTAEISGDLYLTAFYFTYFDSAQGFIHSQMERHLTVIGRVRRFNVPFV